MNPVALITGGSRGIGQGICFELAKIGYDLIVNYSADKPAARQTAADSLSLGQGHQPKIRAEVCQADISIAEERRKLIDFARARFGRIDLLVNNAGVAPKVRADILEATEESFDRLMSINAKGPYFLAQHTAKWLIEQSESARKESFSANETRETRFPKSKIIFISSVSAYAASVNRGDYCISKAALSMITSLYAGRLAEYGIHVFEIRPGIIATDMTGPVKEKYDRLISEGLTPIQRWGTPEDVGKAVAAIAQDLLPFSTGEVINVDGGFHLRRL